MLGPASLRPGLLVGGLAVRLSVCLSSSLSLGPTSVLEGCPSPSDLEGEMEREGVVRARHPPLCSTKIPGSLCPAVSCCPGTWAVFRPP